MKRSRSIPRSRAQNKSKHPFPYCDADIRAALARWTAGPANNRQDLKVTDPHFEIIMALAAEGASHIQSRRAGANKPRKTSTKVTKRLEAILESYRHLSPKFQARPTGSGTIKRLREGAIKRLGLEDNACSNFPLSEEGSHTAWQSPGEAGANGKNPP